MTSTTTTPSLVFLLVSKALTLRPETKSLPTPPREGIAGANADHADAEDFQARVRSYHCRLQPGALVAHCPGVLPLVVTCSPGILPFWAHCCLPLGRRTLQLHENSWFLLNSRDGRRTSLFLDRSHCAWPLAKMEIRNMNSEIGKCENWKFEI